MKDYSNENNLKFSSETFNEDYNKLIQDYLSKNKQQNLKSDNDQGRLITPNPVCVFKTFDDKEEKIFINILSHKDISAPKEENILEMNNQYGIRVPMSISEKNEDFDNAGKICSVYDAIFNDKVTDQAIKDTELMKFILTLILERILQRFNHKLDFNKLKPMRNLKYKGKAVRSQMIKIVEKKVEEVINKHDNLILNNKENGSVQEIIQEQVPLWNLFISKEKSFNVLDHIKFISSLCSENELKRRIKSFSSFSIENINLCSKTDEIKIFQYDSYNINSSFNWDFMIFQIDTPLLSKSFAVKISVIDNNIILLKVPKLYSLSLNVFWMNKVVIDNTIFDPKERKIYIFIKNLLKDTFPEKTTNPTIVQTIDDTYIFDLVV